MSEKASSPTTRRASRPPSTSVASEPAQEDRRAIRPIMLFWHDGGEGAPGRSSTADECWHNHADPSTMIESSGPSLADVIAKAKGETE